MAFLFTAMGNILTTIEFIQFFSELGANNAQAAITLDDIARIVRTEHLTIFRDLEVSDLRNIHSNFYQVWLPTITARTTITANDVNSSTGPLNSTFIQLQPAITLAKRSLDRLETIYRQYSNVFHVDDLVQGIFLFIEMNGLLLHMHSAYATLRRVSMGADSLDDPVLLADTLAAQWYGNDAHAAIEWLYFLTYNRRFSSDFFTGVRERWISTTSYRQQFYYEDHYTSLNSTPQVNRINVSTPHPFHAETVWNESSATVRTRVEGVREQRRRALDNLFSQAIANVTNQVLGRLSLFTGRMWLREIRQREGQRSLAGRSASFMESRIANLSPPKDLVVSSDKEEAIAEKETGLALPVNVDEYRALSEYLYVTTTGKEASPREDDVDVKHRKGTDHLCPHCHSALPPAVTA